MLMKLRTINQCSLRVRQSVEDLVVGADEDVVGADDAAAIDSMLTLSGTPTLSDTNPINASLSSEAAAWLKSLLHLQQN